MADYRIPLALPFVDVVIEPTDDPYSVRITLPPAALSTAILPRNMFSEKVNEHTAVATAVGAGPLQNRAEPEPQLSEELKRAWGGTFNVPLYRTDAATIELAAKALHDSHIFIINSNDPDSVQYGDTSPRNKALYRQLAVNVITALNKR